jgi:hypothetical protein
MAVAVMRVIAMAAVRRDVPMRLCGLAHSLRSGS